MTHLQAWAMAETVELLYYMSLLYAKEELSMVEHDQTLRPFTRLPSTIATTHI